MYVGTKFIKNERQTHSTVSAGIHSGWQKKGWTTKKKMQRQTPFNMEQASMAHNTWLMMMMMIP
jgi:hypothetical protein